MEQPTDPLSSERYLISLLRDVSPQELGRRLKTHRKSAKLSIRELAARSMVSKTSIVSLEQGNGCRPVTLEKICRGMRLHVERLAIDESESSSPVLTQNDPRWYELDSLINGPVGDGPLTDAIRIDLKKSGIKNPMQMFRNVPSNAGFIAGVIELNQPTEPRSHPGAEFGYVLEGVAMVLISGQSHLVKSGESFYVPTGVEHAYGVEHEASFAKILLFRLT